MFEYLHHGKHEVVPDSDVLGSAVGFVDAAVVDGASREIDAVVACSAPYFVVVRVASGPLLSSASWPWVGRNAVAAWALWTSLIS